MAKERYGLEKFLYDIEQGAQSGVNTIAGIGGGVADTLRRDLQNTRAFLRSDPSLESKIKPDFSPVSGKGGMRSPTPAMDLRAIDASERNRLLQNAARTIPGLAADPNVGATPGGAGGGMGANPIQALFAPMFEDLKRQRQLANKRYEANRDQVTNIYGQITGARSADVAATETAFKRLVDAAAARSTAVNAGIDASEAQRLQQNQAALQGMGLEGLSTSQGDIASQTAAQAQQTNALNSANWENMLRTMGATAGEQVKADVAGYNYAMLEDLGRLRGAREEFAQELGQQRGELRSQRAQATFEYQQAQQRAAAAAKAARQRAKADARDLAAKQEAEALKESGPVIRTVANFQKNGFLSDIEAARVTQTVNEFFANNTPATGRWNTGSALATIMPVISTTLNPKEQSAITAIFNNIKW